MPPLSRLVRTLQSFRDTLSWKPLPLRKRRPIRYLRPRVEQLEDRIMLDCGVPMFLGDLLIPGLVPCPLDHPQTLVAGNNLKVVYSQTITVPSTPSTLTFDYSKLHFDTQPNAIKDAFEAALVDANGSPLVGVIAGSRDAFYNLTAGQQPILGVNTQTSATTSDSGTISVDLAHIPAGTQATLVVRLINDDGDTGATVTVDNVQVSPGSPGTPLGSVVQSAQSRLTSTSVNFASLSDVTSSMGLQYGTTSFVDKSNSLFADLSLQNNGNFAVRSPLVVVVDSISNPTVTADNYYGVTPDGKPYFLFNNTVAPGATTPTRTLEFLDPSDVPFTYRVTVLGQLNQQPVFASGTVPAQQAIVGVPFVFTPSVTDPDGDPLTFSLLGAPSGMTINPTTGAISWIPQASDVGSTSVKVQASDGQGGTASQQFTVNVINPPPNQPPVFTSTPVVDANANTAYSYQATAQDQDGDPLTFSVLSGPKGLTVDSATGLVQWTPTATQVGVNSVTLQVNDGQGGTVTQVYSIAVQPETGDHAPVIVSQAVTSVVQGQNYSYQVQAIDADSDPLTFSLLNAPSGMTIDANGLVSWPAADQGTTTSTNVTIQVADGRGGFDTQSYTLGVVAAAAAGSIQGNVSTPGAAGPELVVNGNFNAGNTGFTSAYTFSGGTSSANFYGINTNPENFNPFYASFTDRTNDGNMMFINAKTAGATAWEETVSVAPNDTYSFSAWASESSLSSPTADLSVLVNGQPVPLFNGNAANGNLDLVLPALTGPFPQTNGSQWVPLQAVWNAGTSTTATIQIIDNEFNSSIPQGGGNDFALDDISFRSISNLVVNGNFNAGNTGFTSAYSFSGGTISANFYGIGTNPDNWNPFYANFTDRTNDGNMMFINAKTDGAPLWQETLNVAANTTYDFSAFATAASVNFASGPDADLTVLINGQAVVLNNGLTDLPLPPLTGPFPQGNGSDWVQLASLWNSGSSSTATIQIINNGAPQGNNDLCLDDIVFGQPFTSTGQPGWTAYLDQNNNGKLDPGEPTVVTDTNGNFTFNNVAPGSYTVALLGQPGWSVTTPSNGTFAANVGSGQTVNGLGFIVDPISQSTSRPPTFTSQPPITGVVGQLLEYQPTVSNPDGLQLVFDLATHPAGMVVDLNTGAIAWTPTIDEIGPQNAVLRMTDSLGRVALQNLPISVDGGPVITSEPGSAIAGLPFQYQVTAQENSGTTVPFPVAFSLPQGPSGMVINSSNGQVTWVSPVQGTFPVSIVATDSQGLTAAQNFNLDVSPDSPETLSITSTPGGKVALGTSYLYQVDVSNPNDLPLTYSLPTAPAGMTIDPATGIVRWSPTASQFGVNSVTVRVDDNLGDFATQNFTVDVVTQNPIEPPSITSTPSASATVGVPYSYTVQATDPQGAPLAYALTQSPIGMTIDSKTGQLSWTPSTAQLGPQTVAVQALDGYGASTTQTFTVTVHGVDIPPVITSQPPTTGAVNQIYLYQVQASDAAGNPLTYSLTGFPNGMTISAGGLIQWIPQPGQFTYPASVPISVQVDDGQGGIATQNFNLVVSATPSFPPPTITSTPSLVGVVGGLYSYQVAATVPNGDTVNYSLPSAPAGMTIDANGLIQWTPSAGESGSNSISVMVTDTTDNEVGTQSFTVNVLASASPPQISSTPVTSVTAGLNYLYNVQATDPNGLPITYSLSGDTIGLTVDSFGRITGPTTTANIGVHPIVVTATDSLGLFTTQNINLSVSADTQAPTVNLTLSENPANVGDTVQFLVAASDNVGVQSMNLTVGGTPLFLDANGIGSLTVAQPGPLAVVATATDAAGNTGTANATLNVISPTVSISSPTGGDTITAPENVIGTVSDPQSLPLVYTLAVAAVGTTAFTQIASGTSAVSNGTLGQFDPTMLQNGSYTLRLQATYGGSTTSTAEITVNVSGNLKLGNFTLAFNDLTVPVSGIPITVTRTYDTLQANQSQDFGYGWRLDYRDTNLQTNLVPDFESGFDYTPFQDGTRVYLTLPGGQREGFTFEPTGQGLFGVNWYYPNFVPDPGVTDQLSVSPIIPTLLKIDGEYFGLNGEPYNPANPAFGGTYTVTQKDGTSYKIDANTGQLQTVTDTNNNTLTFSDSGVTSSTGTQLTFTRDPQNRIVSITDPLGKSIQYTYDAQGDLTSVTDRLGNVTQFVYRTDLAHYLDHVVDPLGRTGVRTNYDPVTGRLTQLTDAAGQPVNLSYNAGQSLETSTDALGNTTTFVYDQQGNIVKEVDPLGGITQRTFDANNNLLSMTDPLGNTTTYAYDGNGNLISATDPLGNTYSMIYGPLNRLLSYSDPLGNTTTSIYDSQGNLLTLTDAAGNTSSYAYNSAGNMISTTDAGGNTTRMSYDGAGHLDQKVDALGNTTNYTVDANGNVLSTSQVVTGLLGTQTLVTQNVYDANGQLTSYTDPTGAVFTTQYDADGNKIETTDALGRVTKYVYDSRNHVIETEYADGTTLTATYDADGRMISSTDRAGRTTTYAYDADSRLISTTQPDGSVLQTQYDADGRKTATTDALGNVTQYQYDADGRQTAVIDSQGGTTTNTYDAAGNKVAVTDPLGNVTRMIYDPMGRPVTTIYANGTSSSTTFDYRGKVTSQTDQNGNTTTYQYDALGRLTGSVDALGGTMAYGYDQAGRLTSQRDANGNTAQYAYNGAGNRVLTILPMGQRESDVYDADGNLIQETDYNGDTTTYQYDTNNRLTDETFADGSSQQFTYTATGQTATAVQVTSGGVSSTTTYQYDSMDRLILVTEPDGSSIAYTYDAAGNETAITLDGTQTTKYTYDQLNRLQTVTDPQNNKTTYHYDADGDLIETDLPDGITETRSYDSQNRLVSLQDVGPGNTVIESFAYAYDNAGNILSVTESGGRTVQYTYDQMNRLTQEAITDPINGNRTFSYTYDPLGNRLSMTDSLLGTTTYSYDANDRLMLESLAGAQTQFTYDNNGNMLSSISATDQVFITYDKQNRESTAQVTDSSGTHQLSFQYDPYGNRISETVDGNETRQLVDTNRPLAEVLMQYTPGGTTVASYIYGNRLISEQLGSNTYFYLTDLQGSTRALADSTGTVVSTYNYDAFGNILQKSGTISNSFLFAGQQFDSVLKQYDMRAREYDPQIGRFLRPDPLLRFTTGSAMRVPYAYANSNPANFVDPTGLDPADANLAAQLTVIAITTTLLNAVTTGAVLARLYETGTNTQFSGLIGSFRYGGGARGFTGAFGFDLLVDFKTRDWYVALVGELGLAPVTGLAGYKPGVSASVGPVFNMNQPSDLAGLGFSATWPLLGLSFDFLPGLVFGMAGQWLSNIAKAATEPGHWSAIFSLSAFPVESGPVAIQFGPENTTFSWTTTYASEYQPVSPQLYYLFGQYLSSAQNKMQQVAAFGTDADKVVQQADSYLNTIGGK